MLFWKKKKPSHDRAMDWFKANMVPGQGIIVHTRQPVPYPEVTGYFIPTLYNWGEKELARTCTKWLMSIQLPDGAFPAPDGVPYTFDTAQIMRGLCAALGDVEGAEASLRRACDWMLTQVDASGRLKTPSTELWSDIANDLIHTYALPPLAQAGKLLGVKEYEEAANFVLAHYKQRVDLVPFNRLSHFHAYAMEALCEMGELELAAQGMADVERCQRADGRQHSGLPGCGMGLFDRHGAVRDRLVYAGQEAAGRHGHALSGKNPEQIGRVQRQLRQGRLLHIGRGNQLGGEVFSRRDAAENARGRQTCLRYSPFSAPAPRPSKWRR